MSRSHLVMALAVGGLCLGASVRAGDVTSDSPLGRKAESFTLNDFYGKSHSLADYKDKKVVVLAFLGTECPLARLYGPRLAELDRKLSAKGVQFLAVDANRQDAITEIASYARVSHIDFPILKDLNNKVADQIGAKRTPEVFVLDQDRVVRYHGKIDNQYGIGFAKKTATEPYVETAVKELLAGQTVAKAETPVVGCFIGRVRPADATSKITYCNQVVRVLNKRCVECHREGQVAPFAMTSYEEVSGWADTMAEVVRQRRMPPWLADPSVGHFSNDRSMTEDEKEILYQWAAAGAPEGDPKELPPAPKFVEDWQLPRHPDAIYYMTPKPHSVPATGVVDYQYFTVDPHFKQDMWLTGIEAQPGNRAVVHHIIVFACPPGDKGARDEGQRQFLTGFAPGAMPMILPPGMAKLIPAGWQLLFQMHYTPNGAANQTDRSRCGLTFTDVKNVKYLVRTWQAINTGFDIPAGADHYRIEADSFPLKFDAQLLQLFPHAHLRGKYFDYELRLPDGKREMLLKVPNYDFGWQLTYALPTLIPMPKGSIMHCVAYYDNSENNLNNPNPKVDVHWGDQTFDEMMIGFYDVAVPLSQEDIREHNLPDFSPGPEDIARSIIERFDKNHDGKVSQSEIPIKPLGVKLFFATMDKNHDGIITVEEVTEFIKERQKERASAHPGRGGGRFLLRGLGGGRQHANPEKPADNKSAPANDNHQAAK